MSVALIKYSAQRAPSKKRRTPIVSRWLGFYLVVSIEEERRPIRKVLVRVVPAHNKHAQPESMLIDQTSHPFPLISKDQIIPITEITFGQAVSYVAVRE